MTRRELSQICRAAMRGLDLRPSLRLVLTELVGCWGEKTIDARILVYPSNEYLVEKTGLSERAVRYGIRGLVEARLITPKDSANGKRFAIKNRSGLIVDVFGFDLTPLYARRAEFVELNARQDAEIAARARLFDEATICRRAVQEVVTALARLTAASHVGSIGERLDELVSRTPKRRLNVQRENLLPVVEAWRSLRGDAEEAYYQAASGGKPCSHIESRPPIPHDINLEQEASREIELGENPSPTTDIATLGLVVEACPSLAEFVTLPQSEVDLVATARHLRASLGASNAVWLEAEQFLGPVNAAAAVCLVFQIYNNDANSGQPQRIRNPGGYLRAVVRTFAQGRANVHHELLALIRKRGG